MGNWEKLEFTTRSKPLGINTKVLQPVIGREVPMSVKGHMAPFFLNLIKIKGVDRQYTVWDWRSVWIVGHWELLARFAL